jgi:hypothetical protein
MNKKPLIVILGLTASGQPEAGRPWADKTE